VGADTRAPRSFTTRNSRSPNADLIFHVQFQSPIRGWKAARQRDSHLRRARHHWSPAQGCGGALHLDRRPGRNRYRIDADFHLALCNRFAAPAPPPLGIWLDQVRERLARSDLIYGDCCLAGLGLLRHKYIFYPKEDWRGVASFLDEREQPTDCVLIVPAYDAVVLDYYRRKNSSCQWGATKLTDLPAETPTSVLFGVFYLQNSPDYVDELRRRGWRDLDRTDFRGVQVVTFSR
jgi:hypothetical protein